MRLGAVAFLCGILLFQQLAELPNLTVSGTLVWSALLLLVVASVLLFQPLRPLLFLLAGFHWAFFQAFLMLSHELPSSLEKQDVVVIGTIASLPQQQGRKWRFQFDIEQLLAKGEVVEGAPQRIRLNWYSDVPMLTVGERWQLTARLKKPHGFSNPGGFDYEGWLFQQRIQATGYVRATEARQRLSDDHYHYPIQRLRQQLAASINSQVVEHTEFSGIVAALAIGERSGMTPAQWEVLSKSGTIHLVAISGLHIGLVAGMVFFIVLLLWPRLGAAALHWPAPRVAALAGLLAATLYAALAGFTIPTQRALVMVAVAMLMLFLQRQRRFSDTLALALFAVLLVDPFTVMSVGFWLSFGAVSAIIYAMSGRLNRRDIWWRWGRVHVVVAVALLPFLLVSFQQVPLLSPLANVVAVPWVSLCVVPLVLLGVLVTTWLPDVASLLLTAAATTLSWLWPFLEWIASYQGGQWQQHPPAAWTLLPALIGILLLLAPAGVPGRWLGVIWLLPLFLITPQRPAAGEWWFTLLDVGQGLAAVVQTQHHTLVYDTGPRFSETFDAGRAVVVPFLRSVGVSHVDALVVGHGDNDHIGGARSVTELLEVRRLLTSVPEKVSWQKAQRCLAGQQWQWDGVLFEMLHPLSDAFDGNNASCVLKVSSVGGQRQHKAALLITGDIEASAERALLAQQQEKLAAEILVVPHHGSSSSSTPAFVTAVSPDYALFPLGYLNRYQFPAASVSARYRQVGAMALDSASSGAITFRVNSNGAIAPVRRYRDSNRRYWH